MSRPFAIIAVVIVLLLVGGASLFAGMFERRMAIAQEDTAVLDYADPQADYVALEQDLAKLPWTSRTTQQEIRRHRAELQYWKGDYTDLVEIAKTPPAQESENTAPDPELMFLAANATFRTTQHGPQDKATLIKNLDGVIHAYLEALRAGNDRPDAAFNYELAVRIRAELVNGRKKGTPTGMMTEDKTDSNMHGDPGEPPKDMKVEQFQVRIPMDPKDTRSNQDQTAGTGQPRRRRG